MASTMRLKEIKIKGFRGYGKEEQSIDLSSPVVLLYGGNRSGKSSTINAIEWALYGGEVAGKKIGIAERSRWQTRNLNCDSIGVELVLESDKGDIHIFREMGKTKKRSGEPFYYVDENGAKCEEQERLWDLLGMDARDFMNSAYLHQEVVRDIVVNAPSVREEALNRLLGISDLYNLSSSLKGVGQAAYVNKVDGIYSGLQNVLRARSAAYQETIDESYEEGERSGMGKSDFTAKGFEKRCLSVSDLAGSLAEKAGIKDAGLKPPKDTAGFRDYKSDAIGVVRRLRDENPGAVSQAALIGEREGLDRALSEYKNKANKKVELERQKRELEKEGTLDELQEKKERLVAEQGSLDQELGRINARMPVIDTTITYLENLEDRAGRTACPACEQDIDPDKVLERLNEVKEGMGDEAEEISGKKKELAEQVASLGDTIERLEQIEEVDLPRADKETKSHREKISEILKRKIGKDEDPESLVNMRLGEIKKELEKASGLMQQYNEDIGKIEDALNEAGLIRDLLEAKSRIAAINKIKESEEWAAMDGARDRLNQELEAVNTVKDAVNAVINEIAGKRLREAEKSITEYYQALVERPDFEAIRIDPDDHDVYAVSGDDKERVITFFNQGDMNCAALSIFLALGGGSVREGGPGFLILDDPSQSLDSEQKRKLASLIGRVAEDKQVLLATMDEELLRDLKNEVSKAKKVYRLGKWSPVKGPSIKEE